MMPLPMKIKILCTIGPASMRPEVIRALDERGVDLLRINLSHASLDDVEPIIEMLRASSSAPICLDTEGAQVRCGQIAPDTVLTAGTTVDLVTEDVEGGPERFTLWPGQVIGLLEVGDLVTVDFDGVQLRVDAVTPETARATVLAGGRVRTNKAVTGPSVAALPALSDKDVAAIEIGARLGIVHYALSFASSADDVAHLRELAPPSAHVMAKIESRAGVRAMDAIIHAADSVIIDRGDLSREVPLEYVPYYQKAIVRRANRWNRPVYVATNLLESMVTNLQPTIAEENDIANTLLDGVHGLVLAAETAVGIDPVGSVDMVLRAVEAFDRMGEGQLLEEDRTVREATR
jgi:pyruvate kinase